MLRQLKELLKKVSVLNILGCCFKTMHGYVFYLSLKRRYGDSARIFLIPWEGTGDAYYFAQCFREKLRENDVVLDVSRAGICVLQLCGIKNCEAISLYQRRALLLFYQLMGPSIDDFIVAHYTHCFMKCGLIALEGIHGLTYRDFYELAGFCFPDTVYMKVKDDTEVRHYCQSIGIIPGKTVFIAPFSSSCHGPDLQQWCKLARAFMERGWKVITNTNSLESAIPGTTGVLVPYDMILPVLDIAGYFVGIRSGLCDIVISSSCQKVVLYPKMSYKQGTYCSFFDLNAFPSKKENVIQLEIDNITDKIVHEIVCALCVE